MKGSLDAIWAEVRAKEKELLDSPWGKRFPRLQILTVGELLEGKGIEYPPPSQVNVTFKKAPKTQEDEIAEQGKLSLKVKP